MTREEEVPLPPPAGEEPAEEMQAGEGADAVEHGLPPEDMQHFRDWLKRLKGR
jgi:hypothetical protein